ncbi:MAG: EamA family transporter, partial [Clostridium sp.]
MKGHLLAMFTIFIWGNTFVSTKVLLEDFSPYEVLLTRFLIGFIVLLV